MRIKGIILVIEASDGFRELSEAGVRCMSSKWALSSEAASVLYDPVPTHSVDVM